MKTSSLLNNVIYNENKPAINVLFETETTKEIRIVMKKDQVMKKPTDLFTYFTENNRLSY